MFEEREKMIKTQIQTRGICDINVINAMLKVPRDVFVSEKNKDLAYTDGPLPIGEGQTISQPYIVALMTQLLSLEKNDKVLEIGTGSGYQTAILAEICREIYTIEIKEKLSSEAQKILKNMNYNNIHFKIGNAYEGWEEFSPYDRIIVTCAPDNIPENLLKQLKDGGKMVIPIGTAGFGQTLYLIKKTGNKITKTDCGGVIFVPMVE